MFWCNLKGRMMCISSAVAFFPCGVWHTQTSVTFLLKFVFQSAKITFVKEASYFSVAKFSGNFCLHLDLSSASGSVDPSFLETCSFVLLHFSVSVFFTGLCFSRRSGLLLYPNLILWNCGLFSFLSAYVTHLLFSTQSLSLYPDNSQIYVSHPDFSCESPDCSTQQFP